MSLSQTVTNNTVILSQFLLSCCHCHQQYSHIVTNSTLTKSTVMSLSPIILSYFHKLFCHVVTVINYTVILSQLFSNQVYCHVVTNYTVILSKTLLKSNLLSCCHCHRLSPCNNTVILLLFLHCPAVTDTDCPEPLLWNPPFFSATESHLASLRLLNIFNVISWLFLHCHVVTVTDYHYPLSVVTRPILFSHLTSLRLLNLFNVISSLFLHCHAVSVTDCHYPLSVVTRPILFSHLASLRLFNMSHAAFLFHSSSILGCVLHGMDWTSWKRTPNNPLISSHWLFDWCSQIITIVEHTGNLITR